MIALIYGKEGLSSGTFRQNPPTRAASISRDILTRNTLLPTFRVSAKI